MSDNKKEEAVESKPIPEKKSQADRKLKKEIKAIVAKEIEGIIDWPNLVMAFVALSAMVGLFFYDFYYQPNFGAANNYLKIGNVDEPIYDIVKKGVDLETFQAFIEQEKASIHELNDINKDANFYLKLAEPSNTIFGSFFRRGRPDISENIVTTQEILIKMKAFYSVDNNITNDTFITNANKLITEYKYLNPFDVLETQQIYPLNNIKEKSDSSYSIIEDDVNKIVLELDAKNKLVNQYLAKALASYRNSMIAMVISTLSIILGIFFNYTNSRKKEPSDKDNKVKKVETVETLRAEVN